MADRIAEWLDESQRLADEATAGPWDFLPWSKYALPSGDYAESILLANASDDGEIVRGLLDVDGEFIAEARTRLPQAVAALRAVMELLDRWAPPDLHEPDEDCPDCEVQHHMRQAIADALGLEGRQR